MNYKRLAWMPAIFLAACGVPKAPAPRAAPPRGFDSAAMCNGIIKSAPVGTPLAEAQSILQNQGFTCTRVQDGSFAGRTHLNYLRCERTEVLSPGLVRNWHVALVEKNEIVSEVLVSYDINASVQAREASQLPARGH